MSSSFICYEIPLHQKSIFRQRETKVLYRKLIQILILLSGMANFAQAINDDGEESPDEPRSFLSLPFEMIDHILTFLPYDDLKSMRLVSKDLERHCYSLGNRSVVKVDKESDLTGLVSFLSKLPVGVNVLFQGQKLRDENLEAFPKEIKYVRIRKSSGLTQKGISSLKTVSHFSFVGTKSPLDDDIIQEIFSWDGLKALTLTGHWIRTQEIKAIKKWPLHLTHLSLRGNEINSYGFRVIRNKLQNLTHLDLSKNSIGAIWRGKHDHAYPKIRFLNLSQNTLTPPGLKALEFYFPQLQVLNVSKNKLFKPGLQRLNYSFPCLEKLDISYNSLGADQIFFLSGAGFPELTSLALEGNCIGGQGVRFVVQNLTKLTHLDLRYCAIGEAEAGLIGRSALPLQSLNLAENEIGGIGIQSLGPKLPKLISLNLKRTSVLHYGIETLAENTKNLQFLDLSSLYLSKKGLELVTTCFPHLKVLSLADCDLSGWPTLELAEKLPDLVFLNVNRTQITNPQLERLMSRLSHLQTLHIQRNKISDKGLISCHHHPSLRFLDLSKNPVTRKALLNLQKTIPRCKILHESLSDRRQSKKLERLSGN